MVGRKNELKIIHDFLAKLKKKISVQKIFLFGSRAKSNPRKDSDFDILIVSKDFNNKKPFKRSPPFYLLWDYPYDVDFICLTPNEFKNKKNAYIIQQAIKEGIEI